MLGKQRAPGSVGRTEGLARELFATGRGVGVVAGGVTADETVAQLGCRANPDGVDTIVPVHARPGGDGC
jgi:hypothetical protein